MKSDAFPPLCGCSSMAEQKLPKLRTTTQICGFDRQPGHFTATLNQIDSLSLSTKSASFRINKTGRKATAIAPGPAHDEVASHG